jgi:hypothetical protein
LSDLFAATPPLEAVKFLIASVAMVQKDRQSWDEAGQQVRRVVQESKNSDDQVCVLYTDISRAYFHAPAKEEKYVEQQPEEWGSGPMLECGILLMPMYGTRDAALNWEDQYAGVLQEVGLKRGKASPCVFHHKERLR